MARWSIEEHGIHDPPQRITVDGRELRRCQWADEERGEAECLVIDPMGKLVPDIVDGRLDIKRRRYRGRVVIEWG